MTASVVTVWEAESASRARGEGRRDPGEDKVEGEGEAGLEKGSDA